MNHVAFVLPGIDRLGGAEREVILLARGLAGRGWCVSLVALTGEGGDAAAELHSAGVSFFTLRMRKGVADPRGWIRFNRWLRAHAPDIVHAHLPHATWMARGSRLLAPVRVVLDTMHTSARQPVASRMGYRMTGWLTDCVTAVSTGVAEACMEMEIAEPERTVVLPNGIDTAEWEPDAAARAWVGSQLGLRDQFLWCATGRLEPVKDYPTLLRALAGLPECAHLLIAASGAFDAELRSLADSLGLARRVQFLGFRNDVRRWMQAADGFVLSSRWEGLPMSLLEAGACAVPCVATAVAGSREVIVEGENGYLAETGSVESLRDAMNRLMRMPPERRCAMGMAARRRVAEHFSLETVLGRWEVLYQQLLAENPHARRYAGKLGTRVRSASAATAPE